MKANENQSPAQDGFTWVIRSAFYDMRTFTRSTNVLRLRKYQSDVAMMIVNSIVHQTGLSIVVQFPRQSGKNELQAQVETYLLMVYKHLDAEIVKVSPTWKPQTLNAMRRLQRVLERNLFARDR